MGRGGGGVAGGEGNNRGCGEGGGVQLCREIVILSDQWLTLDLKSLAAMQNACLISAMWLSVCLWEVEGGVE